MTLGAIIVMMAVKVAQLWLLFQGKSIGPWFDNVTGPQIVFGSVAFAAACRYGIKWLVVSPHGLDQIANINTRYGDIPADRCTAIGAVFYLTPVIFMGLRLLAPR